MLKLFQQILDCGTIRPDRSDKTLKYEVRSLSDLIEKIIPFFERYSLKSSKKYDFVLFSQVCNILKKKNLNKCNLEDIIQLSTKMNVSGKRKYDKQKLLSML